MFVVLAAAPLPDLALPELELPHAASTTAITSASAIVASACFPERVRDFVMASSPETFARSTPRRGHVRRAPVSAACQSRRPVVPRSADHATRDAAAARPDR